MNTKRGVCLIISLLFFYSAYCKEKPSKVNPRKTQHQLLIEQVEREEKALQEWKDEQAKKAIIRAMRGL